MKNYPWFAEISNALNDRIIRVEPLLGGLTNTNFKVTCESSLEAVVRIPPEHNQRLFDYQNEAKVLHLLQPLLIDVELLYFNPVSGIKCTRYVDSSSTLSANINWNTYVMQKVALQLSKIHQIKDSKVACFDVVSKLFTYQKDIKQMLHPFDESSIILSIRHLYAKYERRLCHNDLVPGNILVSPNNVYLIDYEYAGNNIPLFDLVSLINENNRTYEDPMILTFLTTYFGHEPTVTDFQDLVTMDRFQCLLWHHWANRLYDITHDLTYSEIAEAKYQRFIRLK